MVKKGKLENNARFLQGLNYGAFFNQNTCLRPHQLVHKLKIDKGSKVLNYFLSVQLKCPLLGNRRLCSATSISFGHFYQEISLLDSKVFLKNRRIS